MFFTVVIGTLLRFETAVYNQGREARTAKTILKLVVPASELTSKEAGALAVPQRAIALQTFRVCVRAKERTTAGPSAALRYGFFKIQCENI
jgi:hypothetical protein